MNSESKVIVLILSYNGKHLLEDSISSFLANDYPNFDVVVIDNGSNDRTLEWVAYYYPCVYVHRTEKNLAYSGGLNFGLQYAFSECNADFVLISNNDIKADSKVISELVKVAATNEIIGFVTGKVYYYDVPDTIQTVGYYPDGFKWASGHIGAGEKDYGQYDEVCERAFSDDIFMLVKRKVYEMVGGYDTEFAFQWEQFDWQIRAKKNGLKIYYAPKAKIWHKESMTIGKSSPFKTFYDVRNSFVIFLKHRNNEDIRIFHKEYFRNSVVTPFIKSAIKFRWKTSFAILRGYFSAVKYGKSIKKLPLR